MKKIKLKNLQLKNPIILASGTFDKDIAKEIDVAKLGAIVTKTITLRPKKGNPLPHIFRSGDNFFNSVGLKNPGIKKYLETDFLFWKKTGAEVIPSIGGSNEKEYLTLAKILEKQPISAIEINISCPNVDKGVLAFGQDSKNAKKLIRKIRTVFSKNLIVKLSPNVTSIIDISKNCLDAGADILTIANTYLSLPLFKGKFVFKRKIAGLSGPSIKPITQRMVFEIYQKFKCPIIASGGIEDFDDVLDYFAVGAKAVQIGSANYKNPKTSIKILNKLEKYYAIRPSSSKH